MGKKNMTETKDDLRELAEMLEVFQQLPPIDRTAILFYIKGRIDAMATTIEIPVGATAK